MSASFPVPPFVPQPERAHLGDIEDAALDLYQRLSEGTRRAEDIERRSKTELAEQIRSTHALIAALAAERFEFARLVRRIAPELQRLGADGLLRVIDLFARSWDQKLVRLRIEVRDVTGAPISDELEVESHVPDPAVSEIEVRQTLTPLVLLAGNVIGLAKVVTSVPIAEPVQDASETGGAPALSE